jgi:hypothetical protein
MIKEDNFFSKNSLIQYHVIKMLVYVFHHNWNVECSVEEDNIFNSMLGINPVSLPFHNYDECSACAKIPVVTFLNEVKSQLNSAILYEERKAEAINYSIPDERVH